MDVPAGSSPRLHAALTAATLLLLAGLFGAADVPSSHASSAGPQIPMSLPSSTGPSGAASALRPDPACPPTLLAFPLPEPCEVPDVFGDARSGGRRRHEGIDMTAPKMTPVFAATSGTVRWMHDERGGRCCDVEIEHDDGWRSRYIHLNNDSPGTDDGQGWGFAPGVEPGARVERGQLIGWVGDSGNAEHVGPHLHFELRTPRGVAVDPREHLLAARSAMETQGAAPSRAAGSTRIR